MDVLNDRSPVGEEGVCRTPSVRKFGLIDGISLRKWGPPYPRNFSKNTCKWEIPIMEVGSVSGCENTLDNCRGRNR